MNFVTRGSSACPESFHAWGRKDGGVGRECTRARPMTSRSNAPRLREPVRLVGPVEFDLQHYRTSLSSAATT